MNVIEKVTLVATNDYTKNISELVFSPALVKLRPSTAIKGKALEAKGHAHVKQSLNGRFNMISQKKYKEIED